MSQGVCLKFQGCFKEVSSIFQGSFKYFFKEGVLTKSFKGVSMKFKGCFKDVSRVF